MWQIVTGVDIGQLDAWIQTLSDDGAVSLSCMKEDIESNGKESPVDGLDVKDFQQVHKNLSNMREVKIPSTTLMKNMIEQIGKQYGQKKSQEFDEFLISKVSMKIYN